MITPPYSVNTEPLQTSPTSPENWSDCVSCVNGMVSSAGCGQRVCPDELLRVLPPQHGPLQTTTTTTNTINPRTTTDTTSSTPEPRHNTTKLKISIRMLIFKGWHLKQIRLYRIALMATECYHLFTWGKQQRDSVSLVMDVDLSTFQGDWAHGGIITGEWEAPPPIHFNGAC